MRRLKAPVAALVLLALLLTGCVWSRRSVEKVCTEAAEALSDISASLRRKKR